MFHFNSIIVFCEYIYFIFDKKSSEKCKYVIKDNLVPICKKKGIAKLHVMDLSTHHLTSLYF